MAGNSKYIWTPRDEWEKLKNKRYLSLDGSCNVKDNGFNVNIQANQQIHMVKVYLKHDDSVINGCKKWFYSGYLHDAGFDKNPVQSDLIIIKPAYIAEEVYIPRGYPCFAKKVFESPYVDMDGDKILSGGLEQAKIVYWVCFDVWY